MITGGGQRKTNQMEFKRIPWPTDFSENTAPALPVVTSLTQKYQAEVHILYV